MNPASLEIGKVYFSCGYLLRFRPVPMFLVLVYAGKNLITDGRDEDVYCFKNPESYFHEEMAFAAAEDQREDYQAAAEEWHVFSADELGTLVTHLDGLESFVHGLRTEHGAATVFGAGA